MNKMLKVLSTTALLASVAAPFAAPVSAKSVNGIDRIAAVDKDFNFHGASTVPNLSVKEDSDFAGDFASGDTFRLALSTGAEWNYSDSAWTPVAGGKAQVKKISDSTLEVQVTATGATAGVDALQIPMDVKLDGASGELTVKVDGRDSAVTGGSYTYAVASNGKTVAVAEDVKTIGKNGTLGTIRIDETAIGAVSGNHTIKLKAPSGYIFTGATASFGGDYTGSGLGTITASDREITIPVNLNVSTANRGSIYIVPTIKVDTANPGDIVVSVSGTAGSGSKGSISDADVTPGKYADWDGNLKIDEVKEIVSGKVDDIKTGEITLKENVPGSFLANRDIDVELPSWVKVVGVTGFDNTNAPGTKAAFTSIDGKKSKLTITMGDKTSTTSKQEIKFKLQLSVQADKAGDIEAEFKGAGLSGQKLVIAKAVAPVSASVEKVENVKIGTQAQSVGDLVITENKKEAIEKSAESFKTTLSGAAGTSSQTLDVDTPTTGVVTVSLPAGVSFAKLPTVEVVDGNGEIEKDGVSRKDNNGTPNGKLVLQVKSESTKPMKIKLSGIQLTVDRTVPEGDIEAKIGGSAIVENAATDTVKAGQFDTGTAAKVVLAKTVTPAPADTTASNIVFKLNSKTFTIDGKEVTMDAAPLVAWDRAFLPVRFAANALNVSDDNIIWDDKTSTATIFKGDRVVVAKVGDKFLTVNGAKVPMDVPVYRSKATNDRVMIPVRYLSNALGADIQWNQETNEITIKTAK
ncbi:copper amine oxidase N-terminal domain-containing protein [Aneurinibacillus uraniidurans]|uniref:copper amine oxidase N-terminal domain-containing protein n=1 Tax=Aneurinibacillus uraniidurans TaxID=2966586 RepID=UPI00234B39E5|nr:copper amine oxidase N-terminal domain-containing protein [Aneurinibacillus sp. B1]WCN38105.1 copper amine oxidase N-terminal domain-containing protein [Aneurinibacillus sp. B1]